MKKTIKIILFVILSGFIQVSIACTTWASVGAVNQIDGLLIAKNRDAPHHDVEKLMFFSKPKQIKYFALVYRDVHQAKKYEYPYISAGVNEKGLVVINNAASTVPKVKNREKHESITMKKILAHYASVAAVLKDKNKLFTTSLVNDLIVGDAHQIAVIEIGLHGKFNIKTTRNGYLYHTNQYEGKNLLSQNKKPYHDSIVRYQTIAHLLKNHHKKFTFQYFYSIANRQKHGLNDSIFRKWTVATWIAQLPVNGGGKLYVRFTNPNQKYHIYRIDLNKQFWQKGGK